MTGVVFRVRVTGDCHDRLGDECLEDAWLTAVGPRASNAENPTTLGWQIPGTALALLVCAAV